MKNLFILLFCSLLSSFIYANTLIITSGPTCCAMGTYLANAIKSFDTSYHFFSQNDDFNEVCFLLLSTEFPDHMAIIGNAIDQENIIPSIVYGYTYFRDVSPAAKLQAIEAIECMRRFLNNPVNDNFIKALRLMKNHVRMVQLAYSVACKNNIIWERRTFNNWNYDTEEIENLFDNVITVITYCHPISMVKEWLIKDHEATIEKKASLKRHAKQVITSFFAIFQPVDELQEAIVILTKDEFDHIIDEVTDYIKMLPNNLSIEEESFTQSEFTVEDLFNFKTAMYEKFDFENVDRVGLAPILDYDVLLSSKEDCLKFAQEFTKKYSLES